MEFTGLSIAVEPQVEGLFDSASNTIVTTMARVGRAAACETTFRGQRAENIYAGDGETREDFIEFRTECDARLTIPKLIIRSLRVNMRPGTISRYDSGASMLKVPVNG